MHAWDAVRRVWFHREGALIWACLACCWPVTGHALEIGYETEFLDGLRSRGLYRLGTLHAEGILRREDLPNAVRIDVATDLAQTLAEWGNASAAAEREERWKRAHVVLAEVLAKLPTHPRASLLELQDALLWYREGDLAKEEAVLVASDAALATARERLRQAIRILEQLAERIDEALRQKRMARGAPPASADDFTIDELTSLDQHIRLVTAQALASQAETYPTESSDRISSLTRAIDQLKSLLQRAGDNDLRRQAELELVAALRLLGHQTEARQLLGGIQSRPEYSADAAAEEVRLLVAEGRVAEALAAAARHRENVPAAPALLLAHLEAIVAGTLARPAQLDPPAAISAATGILQDLEQSHAPRMHRRGELWLARLLAATNQEASTAQTARLAAEGLYRAGRAEEAVSAFDRAAELARQQKDAEAAFDLALTAAAIVHERGDFREAARRYSELADSSAAGGRPSEAHRLGILAVAEAARTAQLPPEQSELLAQYGRRLEEHLARWPSGPASDEVRIWLARWRLKAGDAAGAIGVLQEVDSQSDQHEASRRLLIDAYQRHAQSLEAGAPRAAVANEAAHLLQPLITGTDNRWPTAWTDLQREVAVSLARLQLAHVDGGAAYAQRLLTAAITSADGPLAWRQEAVGLLLIAEALLGNADRAEDLLGEFAAADAELKAQIVSLLTHRAARADEAQRRTASELALRIVEGLQGSSAGLDEDTSRRLAHQHARALAAAGRQAEAVAAYRSLVHQQPDDPDVHEEYAHLLAASDSPDARRLALRTLQEIERRTKPGGERYMRARLTRIRLLTDLDERPEARKLLKLTLAVHPQLGGPALRQEFATLAAELRSE